MLIALLVSLLSTPALAQDNCRPPEFVLNEIEEYVGLFELTYAKEAIAAAEDSYGCSVAAAPETLARIMLADGVIKVFGEDIEGAKRSFAAAHRIAPDVWNANYGEDNKKLYDEASVAEVADGEVKLLPNLPEQVLYIDGKRYPQPATVPAGMHLVQAGIEGEDTMRFARFVRVNPEGSNIVKTGLSTTGNDPDPAVTTVDPDPVVTQPQVRCGAGTELVDGVCVASKPVVTTVTPDPDPVPTEPKPLPVDPFADYLDKKGTSKKPKRMAAFIGNGITAGLLFGGSLGTRMVYDYNKTQWEANTNGGSWTGESGQAELAITVNALHVSSILFGGISLINLSKALNTPSDDKIAEMRANGSKAKGGADKPGTSGAQAPAEPAK